ncbi:hypothetical protein BGZ63DRAFT_426564 [Mariannaea sp. PMI_226]|nr:hypothetical protein BGZ63DRAFT_426564 [Mariannaea sp. PMI_226]
MPRTTRSRSKVDTAPVSNKKAPRGRPKRLPNTRVEQSQGGKAPSESQAATNNTGTPTPVVGRQTRSQGAILDDKEIGTLARRRRIHKEIEDTEDKAPKRRRSSKQRDEDSSREPDNQDENQESAPNEPFFDKINKIILPEEIQRGTRSRPETQAPDGANKENNHEVEESHEASQPSGLVDGNGNDSQEQAPKNIVVTQLQPSNRGRPKKKQKKKVAYAERIEQRARQASVELGSDIPALRESQPNTRSYQADKGRTEDPEKDVYDPESIVDDQDREGEKGLVHDSASSLSDQDDIDNPELEQSAMRIVEDSIFIDSAGENEHGLTVIELNGAWLQEMALLMASKGWTADADWKTKFIIKMDQDKSDWLESHMESLQRPRCRKLFQILRHLWEKCHHMPRAPALEEQSVYLSEHAETLRKSIQTTNGLVEHICTNFGQWVMAGLEARDPDCNWGEPAKDSLLRKLIPMLILVLEESYKVGGVVKTNDGKEISGIEEGRFTSLTLDLPLRTLSWLKRLHSVVDAEIATRYPGQNPDKLSGLKKLDSQRRKLGRYIDISQQAFQQALDQLDHLATAPRREMEARDRDEAIQRAREQKQQEKYDAQERQMQLFVRSLQRMNETLQGYTQQRDPIDEYFVKHGGWHKEEDERLLDMIRKVQHPNMGALASIVPGRSTEEVTERVRTLRERIRIKYERNEMIPPLWCYEAN